MTEDDIIERLKDTIKVLEMSDDELVGYMEEREIPTSSTSNESARMGFAIGKLTYMIQTIEKRGVRNE